MTKRIVLAGGGTAGHLFPGLAVAQQLQQADDDVEVLLIGAHAALDERLLPRTGFQHHLIDARPFPYGVSLRAISRLYWLANSTITALRLLRRFDPTIVFSAGGYVAAPVVVAGRLLGIPAMVHVSDAFPDRASRLLSRWARAITLAFDEAASYFPVNKIIYTGVPVRREIVTATTAEGRELLGLAADKFTVLVTGGSQGARRINEALVSALPTLLAEEHLQIVHLTGDRGYENVKQQAQQWSAASPAYQYHAYLEQMGPALAAADLVVSRAGSSSLGEATALGKPLILIPYPYAGGHQKYNAGVVQQAGGAEVIDNEALHGAVLGRAILELYEDGRRRQAMAEASRKWGRPDAAQRIAQLLLKY